MKVAFNAILLLSPLAGVGQYALNLARELAAVDAMQLELFYGSTWSRDLAPRVSMAISSLKPLVKRWLPYPYETTRALQQIKFSSGIRRTCPDLYHEPSFLPFAFAGPTVLTVHDLSWIRHPETHPVQRVRIMNKLLPPALERAAHVIAVSDFVRREIIDHYRLQPSRIAVTHEAARAGFKPKTADERRDTLTSIGLHDQSYFLCVGTLEPRKNVSVALEAHARMPESLRRRFPLVLVGMRGWLASPFEPAIRAAVDRQEAFALGFVPDDQLVDLYAGATALVYPSLYEGFGLPPLEAMACGTPVVMSNASSLPEVGGDAAILHDPLDIDALRMGMQRMIEDSAERERRASASLAQAARFSWTRCASETIDVYRSVLAY